MTKKRYIRKMRKMNRDFIKYTIFSLLFGDPYLISKHESDITYGKSPLKNVLTEIAKFEKAKEFNNDKKTSSKKPAPETD